MKYRIKDVWQEIKDRFVYENSYSEKHSKNTRSRPNMWKEIMKIKRNFGEKE